MEREKYFVITILIPKNSKSLSGHIGPQGFLACQSTLEQWSPLIIEIVRFVGRLLFEPLEGGRGIPVTRFRTFFGTMIISVLFFFFLSPLVLSSSSFFYLQKFLSKTHSRKDKYKCKRRLILQLETTAEGRGDKIESQQATSGAIERRVGHFGLVAPVRAKYPQQAGQTQHP